MWPQSCCLKHHKNPPLTHSHNSLERDKQTSKENESKEKESERKIKTKEEAYYRFPSRDQHQSQPYEASIAVVLCKRRSIERQKPLPPSQTMARTSSQPRRHHWSLSLPPIVRAIPAAQLSGSSLPPTLMPTKTKPRGEAN